MCNATAKAPPFFHKTFAACTGLFLLLLHLRDGRCGESQVLAPQTVETLRADRIRTAYNGSSGDDSLPGYGMGWWLSRDGSEIAVAAGAYGSTPWIEPSRGYGVAVILEGTTKQGTRFQKMAQPIIDRLFGYEAGE